MCEHAVLGPVDPQLGEYPAASILKAAHQKPIAEVDDKTLILADQAEKAIAKCAKGDELLADNIPPRRRRDCQAHDSGTWTHISHHCERARDLELRVNSDMPENMMRLINLSATGAPAVFS